MPLVVRSSKFRHVFGPKGATKPENCYSSIKISKGPWESNMSAVNGKFIAVCLEAQGGGSFLVVPLSKTGRVDINHPKVCGHASAVLDVQWNPFNHNEIASASEDCTIKLWTIPDEGIKDNLDKYDIELTGHQKKVQRLGWHPCASNILASSGGDHVIMIWNTKSSDPLFKLDIFNKQQIFCFSWSYNGSLIAATSKDKKLRVFDVRKGTIIQEGSSHDGTKPSHCTFLGTTNQVFTTGFSRSSDRQYKLWNAGDLSKHVSAENIDTSSGVLMPFWDEGTKMVYLVGKGDSGIRYFEVDGDKVFYLDMYQSSIPHRGASVLPKREVDYMKCEVMRFYRLQHTKETVEPLPMTVPRKSDMFQDDIFPPCPADKPALTAEEWAAGVDKDPLLVAFTKDGLVELTAEESKRSVKLVVKEKTPPPEKKEPSVLKRWGSPEPYDSTRTLPVTHDEYRTAYKELLEENEKLKKEIAELKAR